MRLLKNIKTKMWHYFIFLVLCMNKILIRILPFKKIVRLYSNSEQITNDQLNMLNQVAKGHLIRTRLERVLHSTKFKFVCYEQALTVLFLAKIYRIPVSMVYAIKREEKSLTAHAWTCTGDTFISGYSTMSGYNPVYQIDYTPKSFKNSTNPAVRMTYNIFKPIYIVLRNFGDFILDANYRSIRLNLLLKSKTIHQTTTYTSIDRYPIVFSSAQDYFEAKEQFKILSFGCSTGEEVETLRSYFPEATIVGADINKECLKSCRKRISDENVKFIISSHDLIHKHGPYDAIFCMAVLQRLPHKVLNERITNIGIIYPFSKFEDQLIELDRQLNLNGLMIVHFTQYNFLDTSIAHNYQPIETIRQTDYQTPIFDKNGQLVEGIEQYCSVYIKIKD